MVTIDTIRAALNPDAPCRLPPRDRQDNLLNAMQRAGPTLSARVIVRYGAARFAADWLARIEARHRRGCFRSGWTVELAWQDYGEHLLRLFSGSHINVVAVREALIQLQQQRSRARRSTQAAQALARLETPAAVQTWTTRWSTYWALGGPGRTNSITPAPGNVVFIAPLARWLIARWSSIRHETSTLSQHLTTAGWYPRRAGNQDYRSSFGRPPAGDDFFEGCARDYFTTINSLGTQVWTYACGGTRYGATNAAPGMVPAFMGDVAELRARVAAWHQIAQNGSGGLPYRDPFRRSHTDRINAAQRIVNGGHRRNRQTQAAAGIHFQHGPQMSRWF